MHQVSLFQRVCTRTSLFDAWRKIKRKGKIGGIDGVTIKQFDERLDKNIDELLDSLIGRRYVPEPYQRIHVPKPTSPGEKRALSLPTITDKIVQQAVRQQLEPLFERRFRDVSFAYRPGRGPARAIQRISELIAADPTCGAACADIDDCFDSMDHRLLLDAIREQVKDPDILKLIAMWLKIGVVTGRGLYTETAFGIGQGGILSPLLSNIYLHPLDAYLEDRGCRYVRYADNLILIESNRKALANAFGAARDYLEKILKLRFNVNKGYLHALGRGFVFMGIFFFNQERVIDRSRIVKMQAKLNYLAKRHLLTDNGKFFDKLHESVRGFENYYGRILSPDAIYPRMNTCLTHAVVTCISDNACKRSRRPVKGDIRTLLKPVVLFGDKAWNIRKRWIDDVADICLERFERKNKSTGIAPAEDAKGASDSDTSSAEIKATKAIRRQKARYRKLEGVSRELIIDTPGTFLGKTSRKVVVKRQGVKLFDLPLRRLETINIAARGVTLSSDLIRYCCDGQISLFFSDATGQPWAVVQQPLAGDATLGLLQLQALQDREAASRLAAEFVEGKIRNQINLLKYYGRSRDDDSRFGKFLRDTIPAMVRDVENIGGVVSSWQDYGNLRNRLMGLEADAARRYWGMVKLLLADDVPDFPGRKHRGAADLVNSLLNYGYGFLYRQVWREVTGSGLNPKISFLHAPQGEKPALVFDLVEEFRPQAVDRVVFSMLTKRERFKLNGKTHLLTKPSRNKLIEALLERQGTAVSYRGKKVLLKNIIRRQTQLLCRHLRGDDDYRHFIAYY